MEKWMKPQLKQMCDASAVCRWLDLAPTFAGHVPQYIMSDNIHPTAAGSKAAADAIWAFMQEKCIAQ
jgi:phospholipase/lecithinase/hemolysin